MNEEYHGVPGNVILFYPEKWGEVTKFRHFFHSTYKFNPTVHSALGGVEGHFQKYSILIRLADHLVPNLVEDKEELEKHGQSDCLRSKELAAIIETLFCELYSAVDCARQVVGGVYGKYQGIPSNSTSKLFQNASDNKLDARIPIEIINELKIANTDWFPELRRIRNKVIHSDVGSCAEQDGKIVYWNNHLIEEKSNVIEDSLNEIRKYAEKVNKTLGIIFRSLNSTLANKEMIVFCGIFDGLVYERIVESGKVKDFNSGICKSYKWFEKEDRKTCPFSNICGAYKLVLEQRNSLQSNI